MLKTKYRHQDPSPTLLSVNCHMTVLLTDGADGAVHCYVIRK